jgi:hypothetical protein
MNEPHDPNRTVDVPSAPADSLNARLAAGEAVQALPDASARRSATFRHTSARTATPPICFGHIDMRAQAEVPCARRTAAPRTI